jgi:hypothetical protein
VLLDSAAQRVSPVAPLALAHAAHMPPMHSGVAGVIAHCASVLQPAIQREVARSQTGVAAGQCESRVHCPQTLPGAQ